MSATLTDLQIAVGQIVIDVKRLGDDISRLLAQSGSDFTPQVDVLKAAATDLEASATAVETAMNPTPPTPAFRAPTKPLQ
jgi:hypothetical protein